MPYERAKRIMSNFLPPLMPGGQFGTAMGVGLGFYSPEENWARPAQDTGDTTQTQPSKPPEGAAPAGRTGVQQGVGEPSPSPQGVAPSPAPSFGREILRQNPNSQGVQQMGVRRPLSEARRFGL